MTLVFKRFATIAAVFATLWGSTVAASTHGDIAHAVFSKLEKQVIAKYFRQGAENAEEEQADSGAKKGKKGKKKPKGGKHGKKHAKKGHKGKPGQPPGLAKRKALPPGLAKKEQLPPGLAKRGLPGGLEAELPPLDERLERVLVEGSAVLVEKATGKVLDIIENVLRKH